MDKSVMDIKIKQIYKYHLNRDDSYTLSNIFQLSEVIFQQTNMPLDQFNLFFFFLESDTRFLLLDYVQILN